MRCFLIFIAFTMIFGCITAVGQSEKIDDYVKAEMAQSHTPGLSVAVVQGGRTVFARGYGLANVELSVPATDNTVYELLSVSKQFTATAILIMVDEGKILLDAKLSTYLPDIPSAWADVKVRHLLSHTSGIPDYIRAPGWAQSVRLDRSPADLVKSTEPLALSFQPGEKWEYSNTNYYLLGMIIEKISGKSYAEFLSDRIFRPLGMNATRVNVYSDIIPNRASGYHWQQNGLHNAEYISPTQKWAAGAIVSTVNDLAKWAIAIDAGQPLKPQTSQQMITPVKLNHGEPASYGFGNELEMDHGHRVAGHQGGGLAFNATILRFPDDKLSVIVLGNLTQAPSRRVARHIASFYIPAISDEGNRGIPDDDPKLTETLKGVLTDVAQGKVNPDLFTPQAQNNVIPFIKNAGPRFLAPLGALQSLVLLEQTDQGANRTRRYRAVFAGGTSLIWTFQLTKDGKIISMDPQQQ